MNDHFQVSNCEPPQFMKAIIPSWRLLLLLALTLLSGLCGLSYELLLGRLLGNIAGDQFAVSAAVLVAFLGGIAVGSRLAHRLWRFLWLVELAIGLCGVFFALGGALFDDWIYQVIPALALQQAGLVLLCALPLLLPAGLIGITLPLFSGYLDRVRREEVHAPFATSYGLYNLGAGATVLLIEFILLRFIGLSASILAIAAMNFLVATILFFVYREVRVAPPPLSIMAELPRRVGAALVLASLASAIFQLLMVKLAEFLFGPFRESFALVLALILLGIAVGCWLVERGRMGFSGAMLLTVAGVAWIPLVFDLLARGYAANYPYLVQTPWVGPLLLKIALLTALMLLPAAGFGAAIPALLSRGGELARASGRLLFLSSLANVAGFLGMVFLLHVHLSYGELLVLVAVLVALSITAYPLAKGRLLAWSLAGLALFAVVHRWDEKLLYLGHQPFQQYNDLVEARDDFVEAQSFRSRQDVMAITHTKTQDFFFINGYISMPLNSVSEVLVGAFSTLFAPRVERALVLGVGSGKSASTINRLFRQTDAVEINPAILENLPKLGQYNFNLHQASGIQFYVDDAMHYVRTSCGARYDLILNTVTSPIYFSSAKLYTTDFLGHVTRNCLAPDGVYVTWIDSRIGEEGVSIIIATLRDTFPQVWIGAVRSTYYLLIASPAPLALRQERHVAEHPLLSAYLTKELSIQPDTLSYSLLSTRVLEYKQSEPTVPNTLDLPVLEFAMARTQRGFPQFVAWLKDQQQLEERAALLGADWTPEAQGRYFEALLGKKNRLTKQWKRLAKRDQAARKTE